MKSPHVSGFRYSFLLLGLASLPVHSDTFTVSRTNTTGPGSLPVIINQANATPGDQNIEFAVSGTITLVSPLPTITNNLTINGRVDNPVVISGGGITRIFTFASSTTNFLNHLNLANANTTNGGGAAVNNAGTLFMTGCQLANNLAPNGYGGAISNAGAMTIVSSILTGNQATTGGAIYNSGALIVDDGVLANSQAKYGGAIFNVGEANIGNSTVSSSKALLGFGGGVYNSGHLTVWSSTLTGNEAWGVDGSPGQGCSAYADHDGGAGGGGSAGLGGALFTTKGTVAMTNCTIALNRCGGGKGGDGGIAANYGYGIGGAGGGDAGGAGGQGYHDISHKGGDGGFGSGGGGGGSLGMAGKGGFGGGNGGMGGLGFGAPLLRDGRGGDGGAGYGGGVFAKDGTLALLNCTVALNEANGGAGGVPPITRSLLFGRDWSESGFAGNGSGGGLYSYSAQVSLLNTVIAMNTTSSNSPDLYGAFVSIGFDLIGNNQGATGLSINDYQNVPANLGPLQDNDGPTLTCALLQGSLAIGSGTSAGAPTSDQRGVPRPPGHCDIGAFQLVLLSHAATATANLVNDFVVGATITDEGWGYTNPPPVTIIGGGGSGAQAVAVVSNQVVTAINILNAGIGYTNAPLIVIAPPSITAPYTPQPTIGIAPLSLLTFTNLVVGTNYQLQFLSGYAWSDIGPAFTAASSTFTQSVSGMAGPNGYRLVATPVPGQAYATAQVVSGFVVGADVTFGGSGYVSNVVVSLLGGGGSNATAIATVSGGVVTGIRITGAGNGYTNTPSIVIPPPPASALWPVVSQMMELDLDQLSPNANYQVEFTPLAGRVWSTLGVPFTSTFTTHTQAVNVHGDAGFFRVRSVP